MDACCEQKSEVLAQLRHSQGRVLRTVLAINVAMFAVESVAGVLARSSSLLGDALDMFGDASVYTLSLYALNRGDRWRARAALAKGVVMAILGFAVLGEAFVKMLSATTPHAGAIGVIGAAALVANTTCLVLLLRHRRDDVNMSSVWVCSRNDIIANVAVLGAGALVALTHSGVPDVVVGVGIAALFLWSAAFVIRDARTARRASSLAGAA
ncbi:MAG TPA: cation transporter [Planctomycetota bacterium]|nr:cation transporter [Planctomycetota bacterium]